VYAVSGSTATCSYTSQGTEDTFTVPEGVSGVSVTAVGAQGGAGLTAGGGALGAQVTNTALPVTGGAELGVDVGQDGRGGACAQNGIGGLFDGGNGGPCGGGSGGGGSSALLTMPRATAVADSLLTGNPATDARLLVAGGGGGLGSEAGGGNAGDATVIGAGAGGCSGATPGGPGGVGPTDGTNGGGSSSCGGAGSATTGGSSGPSNGGGGGGGGWFGGGGGDHGGGGGGGSSYGGAGPSAGITITTASSTQAREVLISYTLPASTLAAQLVTDTDHFKPGRALTNKALAIQTAVNAGQTATACADITDFLGLVKAQTGKKLNATQAATLTTDANNLAAALGC
jgi:hypothetical protein